jgi:hypothetical protein
MTEAEWLACGNSEPMLRFIKSHRGMRKQIKQRKQKLFCVSCCRQIWSGYSDEQRHSIEVFERSADNRATIDELSLAEMQANRAWLKDAGSGAPFACLQLFWVAADGLAVSTSVLRALYEQQQAGANEPFDSLVGRRSGAFPSGERVQCAILRDIFGNPFRPITFSPEWRTDTTIALARQMYESRDFSGMPILADALQDAGCDHGDILNHCRQPGEHVRGCWVVDLLSGKS